MSLLTAGLVGFEFVGALNASHGMLVTPTSKLRASRSSRLRSNLAEPQARKVNATFVGIKRIPATN
jgi:hypothetical protein